MLKRWPNVVILLLGVTLASASFGANQLRAHSLTADTPKFLVLLGHQKKTNCQCTFDDQCSCQGALKFMNCVKKACNSGDCQCMEQDGTNHFLESCTAMQDSCSGVGLKCMQKEATCKDGGVAWHAKMKKHAAAIKKKSGDEDSENAPEETPVVDPKKYVLHSKYKAHLKAAHNHGHRVFAQGIILAVVMLSLTIALTSSTNALIAKNTWSIIDAVVVTFIAVSWFIVVIHSFDYFGLTGLQAVLAHMTVSVLFLFVAGVVSWTLKHKYGDQSASIFSSIFNHMVMWCNVGFVGTVQKQFKDNVLYIALLLVVLALWYVVLALIFHYGVKRFTSEAGWGDEIESTMAGAALAAGFVLWNHMLITGSYHNMEPSVDKNVPSLMSVLILNGLGVFYMVLPLLCLPVLNRVSKKMESASIGSNNYWKVRACAIGTEFVSFLPHFSILLALRHLVLEHTGYPHGSIGALLLLALVSTAMAIILISLCAYVPILKRGTDMSTQISKLLLSVGGFIVGGAWVGLLDNSVGMATAGERHPFTTKLVLTGFLTAFIFPTYCLYLKPMIVERTK